MYYLNWLTVRQSLFISVYYFYFQGRHCFFSIFSWYSTSNKDNRATYYTCTSKIIIKNLYFIMYMLNLNKEKKIFFPPLITRVMIQSSSGPFRLSFYHQFASVIVCCLLASLIPSKTMNPIYLIFGHYHP